MKVLMVANHSCVRMDKMTIPLIAKGFDVHLLARRVPAYQGQYKSITLYNDVSQFMEGLKLYDRVVDIVHAHNEPSWYVTAVKESTDLPVILDVHDSFLARITPEEAQKSADDTTHQYRVMAEERNNFQLADGLVFPSKPFGEMIASEFQLNQPQLTLPSYCTKSMQNYDAREWMGGLTYEGRIDLEEEYKDNPVNSGFKYCDYLDLAKKCYDLGVAFHIYPVRTDEPFKKAYDDISVVHSPKYYWKLIQYLSRHDWGLVGNLVKIPEWDLAFPNKMFEYISACVPVVAINAPECSRFLEEEGVGITVSSIEELTERWSEHTEIRKTVIKKRQKFTMDNHIDGLIRLYEEVLQ